MKTEESKAFQASLWYLSRKSRTVFEIKTKLSDRGFDDAEIEKTVEKLKNLKFLDDQKYAKNFIERQFRAKGAMRIKRELELKGVSKNIVEEEIAQIDTACFVESAVELARKKYKNIKDLPKEKIYNRLMSFLTRRGFSYDESKKAFEACRDQV